MNSGYYLGELLGKCQGLISTTEWREIRTVFQVPFLYQNMSKDSSLSMVSAHVERHFSDLAQSSQDFKRGLFHPAHDLKMVPFWITAELIYGQLPPHMLRTLERLVPMRARLWQFSLKGGVLRYSWSRFIPIEATRLLATWKREWRSFNLEAYEYAQKNHSDGPFIGYMRAVKEGLFDEEALFQTVDEALFTNIDVTTGAVSWIPAFLAANPHVQARLREEVMSSDGQKPSYLLNSSSYLAFCILESARLRPVVPFSIPQAAPTERVIDGYVIPAGTNFLIDAYAMNVKSDYWGEDAEVYNPDRFLSTGVAKTRYNFWRFGFGPRQCVGKHAADVMVKAIMIYLVKNYEIRLVDENGDWIRERHQWCTQPDFLLNLAKRS